MVRAADGEPRRSEFGFCFVISIIGSMRGSVLECFDQEFELL